MSSYFEDPYNFIKRTLAPRDMVGEYLKDAQLRRIENHTQEIIRDVAKITTTVAEIKSSMQARTASKAVETLQQGISLTVENEGGEVFFRTRGTLIGGPHALGCSALSISLKNKGGNIYFEPVASSTPPSSWFTGGWAKVLIVAGTVYLYRNELRIIGRGALAGANLALERWERRRGQRDGDVKRQEEQDKCEKKTSSTQTEERRTKTSQSCPTVPLAPSNQTLPNAQTNGKEGALNSTYSHPQPLQRPRGIHEVSSVQYFDPRSPAYPAPYYQPPSQSVQPTAPAPAPAPTPTPAPTAHIRQVLHDKAVQNNFFRAAEHSMERVVKGFRPFRGSSYGRASTDSEDMSARPKTPCDGSGFEADMDFSEEEQVQC